LAKVAVSFSADSFEVNQTLVLRINPDSYRDGENRHLRQAPNRWWQYYRDAIIDRTFPALHGLLPAALVSFDQAHNSAKCQTKCIKLHQ